MKKKAYVVTMFLPSTCFKNLRRIVWRYIYESEDELCEAILAASEVITLEEILKLTSIDNRLLPFIKENGNYTSK